MIPRILEVARDSAGSVIVEFAAVLPVLLVVLVGVLQFGLFFYQYTALTAATTAGIRQFSISRLDANGYNDTLTAIQDASCNLSTNSCILTITSSMITLKVNGTACTSNASCQSALQSAYTNGYSTSSPQPITVTISYPCTLLMPTGWINLSAICPLTMTLATVAQ